MKPTDFALQIPPANTATTSNNSNHLQQQPQQPQQPQFSSIPLTSSTTATTNGTATTTTITTINITETTETSVTTTSIPAFTKEEKGKSPHTINNTQNRLEKQIYQHQLQLHQQQQLEEHSTLNQSSRIHNQKNPEVGEDIRLSQLKQESQERKDKYFKFREQNDLYQKENPSKLREHLSHSEIPQISPSQPQNFPTPNLYRISLQLTTELDPRKWWDNVIESFIPYHATRLLLSVPHDLTDTTNTPWGVKAIYNRDSCHGQESVTDTCSSASCDNGHLIFENLEPFECDIEPLVDNKGILKILQRGKIVVVSREYRQPEEEKKNWNPPNQTTPAQMEEINKAFPISRRNTTIGLSSGQGLGIDLESDEIDELAAIITSEKFTGPTIDNSSYNYSVDTPCLSGLEEGHGNYFSYGTDKVPQHHNGSRYRYEYEEFEQQQPSPWSQSPAPSPVVSDPNINPFFQSIPEIDDDAFNPSTSSALAYSNSTQPVVINNNIYSIVHIPLIHPTTAKNVAPTNAQHTPVPIAILSFLSCIVPYPPNLLHSLQALSPFLATTYSMSMIHQQTAKELTCCMKKQRQQHRRNSRDAVISGLTALTPQDGGVDEFFSGDEYSEESSSSSPWEYATVFSTPSRFGRSPSTEREDPLNNREETRVANDEPRSPSPTNSRKKQRRISSRSHKRKGRSARPSNAAHMDTKFVPRNETPQLVIPNAKMLRLIFDVMPNFVLTCSRLTGACTWVNNRLCKYTGLQVEDMLGRGWVQMIHPEDQARVCEAWDAAFSRGESFSAQYRIRRFDGQYRWYLGRAGSLRDTRGVVIHWFGTCTDVHDQKLAEEQQARQSQIEADEKKYRLLAEAIPQMVFTATPKEGITYVNAKWYEYSGLTYEQTQRLGFLSHVHPDDRNKCVLPEEGTEGEEVTHQTTEVRLMCEDGTYRWFLVKCICVEVSEQGRKWFGTCTDINDHKLLEHKLKEAHSAVQKSMESKTRFLSNMSHEIRTPLIGITGMINFMLDTNLTVEQLDYAHTIQQSADALLLVINDILDLSKVEAGMMKLEMEPFSVHTMIEDANELLSTLAIQKGLELSFIIEDDVPDVICGDRIRLRQVLLNVIGNAIKFTSDGEVFSRCSVQKFDENREMILLFEVMDTGPGFDAEEEAVMFKPFSQVDTSSTRKYGGSGLGLVISKQLIELHGGMLCCRSQKGVGSTFYFSAKFSVPQEFTTPRPQTPTAEVSNSPFMRFSRASVESSAAALPSSSSVVSSDFSSISSVHESSSSPIPIVHRPSASNNDVTNGALPLSPPTSSRPITPTTNSRPSTPSLKSRKPVQIDLPRPACVFIIAEQPHSRVTIIHYVRSILPRTPVPDIDVSTDYADANERLSRPAKQYTHIIINLQSQPQVVSLAVLIKNSPGLAQAETVILTTPIQRSGILEGAQGDLPPNVDFIFKPLNRSKMEGMFDDTTTVRENFLKRRNTHQIVASQKEVFKRMLEDVSGKGLKVLLVEDNFVNQKVLSRYMTKVGFEVTIANNGAQCLDEFFSHPHDHFALILCDLFMPVKDGYETTREIRAWEASHLTLGNSKQIPIIALSADVMSDVGARCLDVGFTTYVSKPVNFSTLSDTIRTVLF